MVVFLVSAFITQDGGIQIKILFTVDNTIFSEKFLYMVNIVSALSTIKAD